MTSQKNTGSYYTPQLLADYVVYRLFSEGNYSFDSTIDVLEPSVGDGIFLKSLLERNYFKDIKKKFKDSDIPKLNIDAVEIDELVAEKTQKKYTQVAVEHEDYLNFFLGTDKKYDLEIGNPPYVRRRNLSDETKDLCAKVHELTGLRDKKPKNLWTSFFMAAKNSLKPNGSIAFILPTDLLQIKYAEEIRKIIHEEFDRVEIFSLNWIYFDDIEQDVVVLICSNGYRKRRPRFAHINSMEDLSEPKHFIDYDNSQRQTLNKWTNYALTGEEFKLLDSIHERINPEEVRYYCDSGAGIVTAANDYYIVDRKTVDKYSLDSMDGVVKQTIKKSSSMFPAVVLTKTDLDKKESEGTQILFVDFPDKPKANLPDSYKQYIKKGEQSLIHQRYKMQLRDNWYAVPSVWKSEAFFTKRSNVYPRVIVNEGGAYVTDAFYRIKMKEGFDEKSLAFSFFNTFTFIYAELGGRYYGGGVLELTPNEFKELPLLYVENKKNVKQLDKMLRSGKKTSEILNFTDRIILHEHYGVSIEDIDRLRKIYIKLLTRRMKRIYNI